MATDKEVIVYTDIQAVELLVKGAKDLNTQISNHPRLI